MQETGIREKGSSNKDAAVEPWLRGTLADLDPIRRQILHALELTREDADRWCADLTSAELDARPFGLAPVAFHLRHIARSLDRLLTYAETRPLDEAQLTALRDELTPVADRETLLDEFHAALHLSADRIRAIPPTNFAESRGVGRAHLPSTVGGLLVHCAEHTQRHAGQLVTTARIVLSIRDKKSAKPVTVDL